MAMTKPDIGVVVIGRNEGERLQRCLRSVVDSGSKVVYVDSGSTDGSTQQAQTMGVDVISLDLSIPFTAARARNVGFEHLTNAYPKLRYIQFVDGDVEVASGWLDQAEKALSCRPQVAIVTGRLRERNRNASVYNRLCDMEWDTPVGALQACGGIFMTRIEAFHQAGGFNPAIIAGEEPELCSRVRDRGWMIWRIPAEMGWHESAIIRFGQWWKRAVRSGHAYAEGACRGGLRTPDSRQLASFLFWGLALPMIVMTTAWPTGGLSLILLLGYPTLCFRVTRRLHRGGAVWTDAMWYGLFIVIGKLAQAQGSILFAMTRLRRRSTQMIEYKQATPKVGTTDTPQESCQA